MKTIPLGGWFFLLYLVTISYATNVFVFAFSRRGGTGLRDFLPVRSGGLCALAVVILSLSKDYRKEHEGDAKSTNLSAGRLWDDTFLVPVFFFDEL